MGECEALTRAWHDVEGRFTSPHIGLLTSGSTSDGLGKVVALSCAALEVNAHSVNRRVQASPIDIWFKTLPTFHVGGLSILVRANLTGASVFEATYEKWSVESFAAEVTACRATLLSLVPTQVFDIVAKKIFAPQSVRAVFVGGGRLSEDLRKQAGDLGWPCFASYGMTEVGSQVATAVSAEDPRLVPLDHVQIRVDQEQTNFNYLSIKSAALLSGWIEVNSAGRGEFTDPKVGGWLRTADLASIASDGSLVIQGRGEDFVKILGENVSLARLETKLDVVYREFMPAMSPTNFDIALVAKPDARLGFCLTAITTEASFGQKIVNEFNAQVMPFERIRELKVVLEIPRSSLGKLQRAKAARL